MEPAIPWYKSKVFIGLIVTFVLQVGSLLGKQLDVALLTPLVETAVDIVSTAALAFAGWHRARSTVQPLTLTKKEEAK